MAFEKKPDPACFERQLKDIIKKFPKSENSIHESIESLSENPMVGDHIPGLRPYHLRKLRLPLKEYGISKRRGLRVVFLIINKIVLTVTIYYKGDYKSETDSVELIKKNLKEILELQS